MRPLSMMLITCCDFSSSYVFTIRLWRRADAFQFMQR